MYDDFIQTDEYNLLEKSEKRMWTKKKFIDTLSKNINFKGDFKERTSGAKVERDYAVGFY